ncbi:MAG: AMP-binding protein [Bryobacteraceae bacterium]
MSTQTVIPPPDETKPAEGAAKAPLEQQILDIVRDLLVEQGKDRAAANLTPKSSFQKDLGLASLDLVELVVRCETRLEMEIPDEIAEQADTPAGWAKAIREGAENPAAESAYRIVPPPEDPVALPADARTLVDVLHWHAEKAHGRVHIHLLEEGKGQGITCDQLAETATRVARGLISLGLVRNDTVAILLPTGADFLDAFFGVQLAGGIPVPIYPPADATRIAEYVERQTGVLQGAGIRFLISFAGVDAIARLLRVNAPTLIEVTTVGQLREYGMRTSARFPEPSPIAVVQYTSGTVSRPRGAVLTHEGVLANIRAIGERLGVRPGDATASWLPLASDLGLVGCWLFSLYHTTPLTLLSPREFFDRPESWLWAIHDSHATLAAAPNYAYEACARRAPLWALEGLDLSRWRVAINGGEMVLPETMERFTRRFERFGFRADALTTAYGLSENSVGVAIHTPGSSPRAANGVYSVGAPLAGHRVRIVGEDGLELAEGATGRIQFRGPSQCRGYYRESVISELGRGANLSGDATDAWMDTGDLGFVSSDELFVVGRAGDEILRAGRMLAPQPIERAACEAGGVMANGAAAVGIRDAAAGTERLIVAVESNADDAFEAARVLRAVKQAVSAAVGIEPDEVRVIAPGRLPRTSNGKLRRGEVRRMILEGRLGDALPSPATQRASLTWNNAGALVRRALSRGIRTGKDALRLTAARMSASGGDPVPNVLGWLGRRPEPEGTTMRGPIVIVSNRCTQWDALSIVSLVQGPAVLAGDAALLGLPDWAARLLRDRVVRTPDQIRHALRTGVTVILLPDSPLGTTVARCRYHLAPIEAAIAEGAPLLPFGMQIIRNQLFFRVGEKIRPEGQSARELRQAVRGAIRNIYA